MASILVSKVYNIKDNNKLNEKFIDCIINEIENNNNILYKHILKLLIDLIFFLIIIYITLIRLFKRNYKIILLFFIITILYIMFKLLWMM
ncbi:hypothetical protein BTW14_gp087 [BeAn 58058 virus]|uniref:hypothetical protein n=1 Tax=BeAn 58058 virus TaxID=67082 RepID=UPI00090994BD|nr:hypothetical protein BTW14_gp087 [BeAn 58058 virus]APG58278.1 hypothetical protein BAV00093 [BeAn 58058 virus]